MRIILVGFFLIAFAMERISNTFNQKYKKHSARKFDQFFTSAMLFLYAAIVISCAWYYFTVLPIVNPVVTSLGICMVVGGAVLRRRAIADMGDDWCVYITVEGIKKLTTTGLFKMSRHPYYWASLIELTGIGIITGFHIIVFAIYGIYLPLLLCRCFLEERKLFLKFGNEFLNYKKSTPFLIKLKIKDK